MTSDLNIQRAVGKVDELPKDFFTDIPRQGDVTSLPADFFSAPIPEQPETTFVDNTGDIVSLPKGGLSRLTAISKNAFEKGDTNKELGFLYFKQLQGDTSPSLSNKIARLEEKAGVTIPTKGIIEGMLRATSEQTPQLLEILEKGGLGAAIGAGVGAGVALVAGQLGPQALIPEEAVTVPAAAGLGAKIGGGVGVGATTFQLIAGQSFNELSQIEDAKGNKIDPDVAKLGAFMSGAIGMGLEFIPVGFMIRMVPGSSAVFKKIGAKATDKLKLPFNKKASPATNKKALVRFLRGLATVTAAETATEVAQESVQIATNEISKALSAGDFEKIKGQEIFDRLSEAAKEAVLATPGIAVPFASPQLVIDVRAAAKASKSAKGEKIKGDFIGPVQEVVDEANAKIEEIDTKIEKATPDELADLEGQKVAITQEVEIALDDVQVKAEELESGITKQRIVDLEGQAVKLNKSIDAVIKNQKDKTRVPTELAPLRKELAKVNLELDNLIVEQKKVAKTKSVEIVVSDLRKGLRSAKEDVKTTQEILISALENTDLSQAERATFIKTIKNIQTKDQLQKRLPEIEGRVVNLINKKARRNVIKGVKKALKNTKAKAQNKILKSKFADTLTQKKFDGLRELTSLTKEQAAITLDANLLEEQETGAVDPIANTILALKADRDSVPVAEAVKLLEDIQSSVREGKAVGKIKKAVQKSQRDELAVKAANDIIDVASIDLVDQTTFTNAISESAKAINGFQEFFIYGWDDILDITFNLKGVDNTEIIEALKVTDQFQKRKGVARRWQNSYKDKAVAALGFDTENQYTKKVRNDHKLTTIGRFINERGEGVLFQLNKAQIRQLWMIEQDPTISDTLVDEKGNAFTQEMITAATDLLTTEDVRLAQERLDFYQRSYDDVNKVFSQVNGVDLPQNINYSPIRREVEGKQQDFLEFLKAENVDGFFQEQQYRASVNKGSLKERTTNILPIKLEGDEAVMQRHIMEMSHYVAFAEKIQEISQITRNPTLRKAIRAKKGKTALQVMDTAVSDFTRGSVREANLLGRFINKINSNFARSVLSLKPAIGIKQLSSIPAYLEFVSIPEFIEGTFEFLTNPKKVFNTLKDSELLQERGANPEKQIAEIANTDAAKQFRKNQSVDKFLGLFIQLGDKGAIVAGGWSVYKAAIKRGLSHEQAITEFERATAARQQSADLDKLSGLQRSGALGRLFSQFLSAPNAYLRAEMQAIRQFSRGKITAKDFGKRMAIYHLLLPATFQFIADGFRYEEEKQAVAMILGAMNGYFILGDLLKQGISIAVGTQSFQAKGINFYSALNQASKGASEALDAVLDNDMDDFFNSMVEVSKAAGKLTGQPIEQGFNIYEGAEDLAEGKTKKGSLMILGWPPGAINDLGVRKKASGKGVEL